MWSYSGSYSLSFHTHVYQDGYVQIEKCASGATGSDIYHLRRLHSFYPSNLECKHLIALISGN